MLDDKQGWTWNGKDRFWRGDAVVQVFTFHVEYRLLEARRRFVVPTCSVSDNALVIVTTFIREWPRACTNSLGIDHELQEQIRAEVASALASANRQVIVALAMPPYLHGTPTSLYSIRRYLIAVSLSLRRLGNASEADQAFTIAAWIPMATEFLDNALKLLRRLRREGYSKAPDPAFALLSETTLRISRMLAS